MNSSTPKMMNLLLLLVVLLGTHSLATSDYSYRYCAGIVKSWAHKALLELEGITEQDNFELKDLLFFLHVPRTGGRFFSTCFLQNLFHRGQRCPLSYDKLRFNPSEPRCKLVATHDDYSFISMLPSKRTSVLTIMRNPVDRVLSTYEFSIEVAARSFIHPNVSLSTRKRKPVVSTTSIWPWDYLVPWMTKDLFVRRDARDSGRMVMHSNVDSYNISAMSMPLHEYIHQPLAYDIVHNGGTFQVAGLTNNSHTEGAREIRQCVMTYPFLGKHILKVAKRRLDQMLYVGLTENHKDSVTMFANMFGNEMLSHLHSSNLSIWNSHAASNMIDLTKDTSQAQFTVAGLLDTYEECSSSSRYSQAQRRIRSLKGIAPISFTKEERTRIPESSIKEIEKLNSLDVELFRHAQNIFSQQRNALKQQKSFSLHESNPQENFNNRISSCQSLSRFWPFIVFAPIFAVVVIIASRGRFLKIKLQYFLLDIF